MNIGSDVFLLRENVLHKNSLILSCLMKWTVFNKWNDECIDFTTMDVYCFFFYYYLFFLCIPIYYT